LASPQDGQVASILDPHSLQKAESARFSLLHLGQSILGR